MSFTEQRGLGALAGGGSQGAVMTWSQAAALQSSTRSLGPVGVPSGEPGLDAGLVKGVVGVPGRVGNASHGAPHYGPPGKERLQPKRIPKINLCGVKGHGGKTQGETT